MTATIERDQLAAAVTFASRALPKGAALPALNSLRLTNVKKRLAVSAFDFDLFAFADALCDGPDFDVLVPGALFGKYVAALPNGLIHVEIDHGVTLVAGRSKVTLNTLNLGDYPTPPAAPTALGQIEASDLATAIASVRECVDVNNARTALRGVVLRPDGHLVIVGLDGYHCAERIIDWHGDNHSDGVIVPLAILDSAKAFTGPVQVALDANLIALSDSSKRLIGRLIGEQLPPYEKPLEAHSPKLHVTVSRAELLEAVKFAALGAPQQGAMVRVALEVTTDSVDVSLPEDGTLGAAASSSVDAKVEGDPIAVKTSALYLTDGLKATDAEVVTLHFEGPKRAFSISAETDPALRFLCMPVVK